MGMCVCVYVVSVQQARNFPSSFASFCLSFVHSCAWKQLKRKQPSFFVRNPPRAAATIGRGFGRRRSFLRDSNFVRLHFHIASAPSSEWASEPSIRRESSTKKKFLCQFELRLSGKYTRNGQKKEEKSKKQAKIFIRNLLSPFYGVHVCFVRVLNSFKLGFLDPLSV